MKNFVHLTFLLALINLTACVEIKDKNKPGPSGRSVSFVNLQKSSGVLLIDEPLYVYDGHILTEKAFLEYQSKRKPEDKIYSKEAEFFFHEITLTRRGALYTLGNNVRIHAESVNSDSGLISTFPENLVATIANQGRAGGHLMLEIGHGHGLVIVVMRGETGGKGLDGAKPDASMKGQQGKTGPENTRECVTILGESGQPGLKGHKGIKGAKGGNSGTLEISLYDDSELKIRSERYAGFGGKGGEGGDGGEGGGIGAPGLIPRNCPPPDFFSPVKCNGECPKLGPQGEKGDQGDQGEKGEVQAICISLRNQNYTCN